ncbi:hypothetical protein I4U23_010581 [Adineta vaga]|nr:hypothetical protein I4U23_010581 [Adineta vaga]
MIRSRKSLPSRSVTTAVTTTEVLPSFDDNFDEERTIGGCITHASSEEINKDSNLSGISALVSEGGSTTLINIGEGKKLKSNVWNFAKKLSNEAALLAKHNLIHLQLPLSARVKTNGRTFGDLRKGDMAKFLAEAIPGYIPPHRNQVQQELKYLTQILRRRKFLLIRFDSNSNVNDDVDDEDDSDEENQDLIVDTWINE